MNDGKYQDYNECSKSNVNGTWSQKVNMLTIIFSTFLFSVVGKIKSVSYTTLVLEFTFVDRETITYKRI